MEYRKFFAATVLAAWPAAAQATQCPDNAYSLAPDETTGLTCECPANTSTAAYLYGTGRYTADSSICLAAVHDGKTKLEAGGTVTVFTGAGCPAFKSTNQNGVTSSGWSSYDKTFAFSTPLPDCALQAAAATAEPAPAAQPSSPPPAKAEPAADAGGPDEWQARADLFAKALPKPLDGWTSTDPRGEWSNSAMNGYYVQGVVWYKKGGDTMNHDVFVSISNMPDGSPIERLETLWNDEAARTAANAKMETIAGRQALVIDMSGDVSVNFRTENGIYVTLSRLASHVAITAEDVEAYAKALDFAKIEKLNAK